MASERQDHNEISPWWGEHVHRYLVALNYVKPNDNLLDLACGNGFGSKLLSEKTTGNVIGGDISEKTIAYCRSTFKNVRNLTFELIDGTNMPFADEHFNLIVSFETIEHTTQYMKMLSEFNRTVVTNGYVIISTPNIVVNSPGGKVLNPYHTQEFNYEQLRAVLEAFFKEVKIYGQQYTRYKEATLRNKTGQLLEKLLYLRGVRKLPLPLQNSIMKTIVGKPMYPMPEDYTMTDNTHDLLKCKTFFAVCRKG